jgi:hypothetical protein
MPYTQRTLAQLQARMATEWDGSVFWTPREATAALNEALRWYNLFTGVWKVRVALPTVANQVTYSISGSFVYNLRMTFRLLPMDLGSLKEMNNGRPNWRAETTASGGDVPTRPTMYIPVGMNRFAIWPADAVGDVGPPGSLLIDGLAQTPILTLPGDFLDLGLEEEVALVGEAIHISAFKLRDARWRATAVKHKAFLLACLSKNERLATSAYFREFLGLDRQKDEQPIIGAAQIATPQGLQS